MSDLWNKKTEHSFLLGGSAGAQAFGAAEQAPERSASFTP